MSRTTRSIMFIKEQLDEISGLDGIVADLVEQKEKEIREMVEYILENHSEANIFDYYGYGTGMNSASAKFDASLRVKEIEKAIRNVQKDGLKVGVQESKLYVENTVYTDKRGNEESFGYSTIDCFADVSE